MALLLQNEDGTYATKCAICDRPLAKPIFGTSHFIDDESDPLWRFSDAGMHWDCYANWELQRQFAERYFESATQTEFTNPYWPMLFKNANIALRANLDKIIYSADVDLRMIGPGPRVDLNEWESWINGDKLDQCVHPLQRTAIENALPVLRDRFPTVDALKPTTMP